MLLHNRRPLKVPVSTMSFHFQISDFRFKNNATYADIGPEHSPGAEHERKHQKHLSAHLFWITVFSRKCLFGLPKPQSAIPQFRSPPGVFVCVFKVILGGVWGVFFGSMLIVFSTNGPRGGGKTIKTKKEEVTN